jgi:hypothetical protein
MNPCPTPPSVQPTETTHAYRATLALYALTHVSLHGPFCTAYLSDEQLEETARGLNDALAQRVMISGESTPAFVYDRLAETLGFIRSMQSGRTKTAQSLGTVQPHACVSHPPDSHPSGGKTIPIPGPAPRPLPPSRQPVDIGF